MTSNVAPPSHNNPVPIIASVAAAYAFLYSHWQKVLIVAAPFTIGYALQLVLVLNYDATSEISAWFGLGGTILSFLTMVASFAMTASVFRMAVLGDYSGWNCLKLGGDEKRVFYVTLLVSALVVLVSIMVTMFIFVVFNNVASAALSGAGMAPDDLPEGFELMDATAYMGTADWVLIGAAGLVGAIFMVWLLARLMMAMPATIANKKVMVLKVWAMSKGNTWRISLILLLTTLPVILLETGLYELISFAIGDRFLYIPVAITEGAAASADLSRWNELLRWNGLMAFINSPLIAGLYAYLYRGLNASSAE